MATSYLDNPSAARAHTFYDSTEPTAPGNVAELRIPISNALGPDGAFVLEATVQIHRLGLPGTHYARKIVRSGSIVAGSVTLATAEVIDEEHFQSGVSGNVSNTIGVDGDAVVIALIVDGGSAWGAAMGVTATVHGMPTVAQ